MTAQTGVLSQPNSEIVKRPAAITVICVLGFIGVGLSVPMILSEIARQIGSWFGPYACFVAVVNLICMIGLWSSKKWGLYTYSALVLVNQVVLAAKGEWNALVLIVQTLVILIILYHLHPETRPTYVQVAMYVKRKVWAVIVAYMIGIHNPYREVHDDPEEIVYTIDDTEEQEDSAPR
ncbi:MULTISPECIES: fungal transcription factor regulatory middle homology region domain-containing protein [unclassified Imperialibacter]|uniref:fungal specific transcription factor domain-containing protein n=1 Tax=unclassified Imperialibacter TaxID=2629706 RepID=UPI0012526E4A|nr:MULTISPECIES: fungal transcription factor regulatory middle homology region domain-containing protein [unclassified Imperialibacter]CAD5267000.1 conserved membrane hypothetical protein [Imperialibacter sp. 89]CAD5282219.1 conserved membrane hypothetical protein [Imperialibacter sp. 75]VVT17317.1 conserved membrane hypothetical protein [Imperialibacter sp. EC-SDR9]